MCWNCKEPVCLEHRDPGTEWWVPMRREGWILFEGQWGATAELGMESTTAFVPSTLGHSWGTVAAGVPRLDASAHVSPEAGCRAPHVLPRPFKSPRAT